MNYQRNLDVGIKQFVTSLKLLGLWTEYDDSRLYKTFKHMIFFLYFIHALSQIIYAWQCMQDFQEFVTTISLIPTSIGAILKYLVFNRRHYLIKEVFAGLQSEVFQPKSFRQSRIMTKALILSRSLFLVFLGIVITYIVIVASLPIFFKQGSAISRAWWPINKIIILPPTASFAISILELIMFLYVTTTAVITDTFFATALVQIGGQCDILCDSIKSISGTTDIINKELKNCFYHHSQILRYCKSVLNTFNEVIMVQFVGSLANICLGTYLLTTTPIHAPEFLTSLLFESGVLVELFYYCWFGNDVTVKSQKVYYALFDLKWYNTSKKLKTNVLLFLMHTRTPIVLKICNTISISLETFVKIIRSAWTYFTALNRANDQP